MARTLEKTALWLAMAALAVNGHAFAQEVAEAPLVDTYQQADVPAQPVFSVEQVEQMVAPIALYPDALLAQVLMAATYPIEVVQADQWLKKNRGLDDEALDSAVAAQPWDPSVKTLVFFPTVLERMAQDLAWTQDLGDAFLAQEADVMGAVQRLRRQAQDAGNLASNSQQIVRTHGSNIVVEPADPTVVYVPTYNPTTVYGSTWVPATTYYPATYGYTSAFPTWVAFGAGVLVGAILTSAIDWADDDDYYVAYPYYRRRYHHHHIHHVYHGYWDADWDGPRYGRPAWRSYRPAFVSRGDVYIDNSRNISINKAQINNTFVKREWSHDPVHRRSVSYRDPTVARRFLDGDAARRAGRDGAQSLDREALKRLDRDGAQQLDREALKRLDRDGAQQLDREALKRLDRDGAQSLDREALKRLDRGQPATLPADKGTREALQGDERERRERIMRGQRDQTPFEADPKAPEAAALRRETEQKRFGAGESTLPPATSRQQLERSGGAGAEPTARPRDLARDAKSWGRPDTGATPAPTPSWSTRRQVEPGAQRYEGPQMQQRVDPRQFQQRVEPQQMQRQVDPRQMQQRVDPRQMQQRVDPRQMQQRVDPRQFQQRVEPQQMQRRVDPRQMQQRVEPRPTPQAVEPRAMQQRVDPRQFQQRVEPKVQQRSMPQSVEQARQRSGSQSAPQGSKKRDDDSKDNPFVR